MKNSCEKYSIVVESNYAGHNMSTKQYKFSSFDENIPSICVSERNVISARNQYAINKIQSYGSFEKNWDSYDADPVSKEVINHSVRIIEKLNQLNQEIYFAAPGPNGEISIELKNGNRNAEMLIYPNKKFKYVFFDNKDFEGQGTVSVQKIPEIIQWLFSNKKIKVR